jgi:hypothetical protein
MRRARERQDPVARAYRVVRAAWDEFLRLCIAKDRAAEGLRHAQGAGWTEEAAAARATLAELDEEIVEADQRIEACAQACQRLQWLELGLTPPDPADPAFWAL